ncbi:surface antigen-domain-containing protein [Pisolithus microcarpus]|nr:surface antigen-domain-containing protein [Pisolithus microcarpus]
MADALKPPLQSTVRPSDREPSQDDLEKRLQRKLRGEYESQQLHLAELVNDTLDSSKYTERTRTSEAFLDWLIRPHLPSSQPEHATDAQPTLHSVLQTTRAVSHSLSETDLFRAVSARIERSPKGAPGDVDLNFTVTERGRFFVKTATEIGNCEGTASITARLTNILGRADTLTFNSSVGTKTKRAFDASFSLPVSPSLTTTAFLSLVGADRELGVQGGSGDGLEGGVHELTAEALWRSIGNLAPVAGLGIRQLPWHIGGPSTTLNDHIMPSKGALMRVVNELAVTKRILPSPFSGYSTSSLWSTTKRGWALTSGSLQVLAGNSDTLHWSDRFQLGGPLSVRGFSADGMGPREGTTSLGGTIYYALGLSLLSNVPTRPTWPIKLHSWVNVGRLQDQGRDVRSTVHTLLTRPSVSAGIGLVYRVDPIRVEANVAFPLVAARGEGLRRGIQVGIGLEML